MSKLVKVELTDTLMRWAYELEFHVQSGDRHCVYYFQVPDAWAATDAELQRRVFAIAQQMYADRNAQFRLAEPNDINYLAVLQTKATLLSEAEAQQKPWLQARNPAIWEWTPCVVAHEDDTYIKVERSAFAA